MFAYAVCLGVLIGLLVAVTEWVMFNAILKRQKAVYEDKIFVKDLQIQELRKDLDVVTSRSHKTTQIAKTASKIRKFPERDANWKVDIPITYTSCN